LAVANTSWIAS